MQSDPFPANHPPLLAFIARSGTGKTTLLERLIPELRRRGLRVALIKHTHHRFDMDRPGKDSYRLREAGADQVLVASRRRWALLTELQEHRPEPDLAELVTHIDPTRCDLILVEGFKHAAVEKIELHRAELGHPLLAPETEGVIAIACDRPPADAPPVPLLNLNAPDAIADFIQQQWLPAVRGG